MRRRRPARLRMCRDREATAAMRFKDRESYISLDGRHIYAGQDAIDAYQKAHDAWTEQGRLCARCGKRVNWLCEEWHHKNSKGKHLRDDHPRNREFIGGRFSECRCHVKEHNREPKWTPRTVGEIAKGLNT